MMGAIFITIFVLTVLILGLLAKKTLYINEYVPSIEEELKTFDENFKAVNDLETIPDYSLSNNHLYNNKS